MLKNNEIEICFIANAPINSKKISIYQTLSQAKALSSYCKVNICLPNRIDFSLTSKNIYEEVKKRLGTKKEITFKIIPINYFDLFNKKWLNIHIKFAISNFSYAFCAIRYALKIKSKILYTRDFYTLLILSVSKLLGLIKNKVIFESHQYSLIRKVLAFNIEYLITINSFQKQKYKHPRSTVLHDGIWEKEFNNKKPIKYVRKTILFAGSCNKNKGIERILGLSELMPDYKFFIASLEDYKNNSIPKKYLRKNIFWLGRLNRKDLKSQLAKTEYCILPNDPYKKENLYTSPMKLFEYLASGRAIIATPINTIKEIMPINSFIELPYNKNEFKFTAEKIRSSNSKEISKNYLDIIKNYTWESRANKFMSILSNIM